MTVAWALVFFACQLGPGAPLTRDTCAWSAMAKPFPSIGECQAEGRRRIALYADRLRPANFAWAMCLPRNDVIAGEPA